MVAQHIIMMVMATDTEAHPTHSACALHLVTMMSPTAAIAMTQMVMPALDKALGTAHTVATTALTMTVMGLKPNATTVQVDVVDGQDAPPTMDGTVETHPVEIQVHGSLVAQQIGSVVIKIHPIEHKNVVR